MCRVMPQAAECSDVGRAAEAPGEAACGEDEAGRRADCERAERAKSKAEVGESVTGIVLTEGVKRICNNWQSLLLSIWMFVCLYRLWYSRTSRVFQTLIQSYKEKGS